MQDGSSPPPSSSQRQHLSAVLHVESDARFPEYNSSSWKSKWNVDISYGAWSTVQMSYMAYSPEELRRTGAPFASKRDSLLFAYSQCYDHRQAAFNALVAAGLKLDAPGACLTNIGAGDIAGECASLGRGGRTVWSQSECLLHHYKFYLAWENSVSMSYVTEKLWQGLASGAVPIYRGAPDIRTLLPHPDAALLWEDFESVDDLVAYVWV